MKLFGSLVRLNGEASLEQELNRYGIEWTILEKDLPANKLLAALPGWRQAYTDDKTTIFVRER